MSRRISITLDSSLDESLRMVLEQKKRLDPKLTYSELLRIAISYGVRDMLNERPIQDAIQVKNRKKL